LSCCSAPGKWSPREELRNQNWPADTFVDFDNSLNTAINKLREALGDAADNPRFIETLPRRGYRFIAPVTEVDGTTKAAATSVSMAASTRSRKIVMTVAVAIVAAGISGGLLWRARQARRLTEKDTIVLGDFANSTGDAVFDGTLREGLSVQLQQSPFSDSRIRGGDPADVANDGTAGECQAHAANRARSLSKDQQHGSTRRFDCFDWRPIRFNREGRELCEWRPAGEHGSAGER